ncbi:Protein of unknown function [Lactobacillus pasteurii DSM 23907 = CRBIP 24.76]|uniref:Uncharacterized protein n=1 Tax=Lactobacillus pasteurii DSM 23907 = CRBIP 24.76 TaxID=1423790 RepID=I7LDX3_9LACO|nr:Protein of unknown function [Lactobacillus pasteurii DSM 23907 = CRBIP 24.76]
MKLVKASSSPVVKPEVTSPKSEQSEVSPSSGSDGEHQ